MNIKCIHITFVLYTNIFKRHVNTFQATQHLLIFILVAMPLKSVGMLCARTEITEVLQSAHCMCTGTRKYLVITARATGYSNESEKWQHLLKYLTWHIYSEN